MAKRKKLKNIKINEQELTPTVIGYLNEKGASPLFLIILFGILFVFLYYLPEINVYIEQKRGNDYSSNVPTVPNDNEEDYSQTDIGKEFEFSLDTKIVLKELMLSDFKLDSDVITFNAKNNSNKIIDLSQNDYYLYLKDENGEINDIIYFNDLVLLENKEQKMSFTVNSVSIKNIIVDTFKEEYIKEISLVNDTLTCVLDEETYIYKFEESILKIQTYIYENSDPQESLIYKYQNLKEKYDELEGVEVILSTHAGLSYKMIVDSNLVDFDKLNDNNLFVNNVEDKIIKFIMENNGYLCS